MANPSTQPPSNATTTNIIFSRDFIQSTYTLLEIPKTLESYINAQDDNATLSFQVRGLEKDTAVLCTPTQTFSLQRAHTSNMLIPIAPLIESRRKDHDMDMVMDMDTGFGSSLQADPYHIDESVLGELPYGRQAALDILDSVLDLIPISPRLKRLSEILAKSQFEGWANESDSQDHLYTWENLQSVIQASDKEIMDWLKEHHACLIDGHWRLFKRRFMFDILREILSTMNALGAEASSVDAESICAEIENDTPESESGIASWMVKHCIASFSEDTESSTETKAEHYCLSAKKVSMFMGVHLLSSTERGHRWRLQDFMLKWNELLQEHFKADLKYLAGEYIVENDRGMDKSQQQYIRYFSKSQLPLDAAARFTALFEVKPKWDGPEIRPFLRDLVLDEKKLDILLLKHARSVKQPGGGVVYSSRVIK
ncbi:Sister chromatid cohesion protein DCC1 [Linnemannia schmuckeri]|uniref:Sister chromatid cohesion protein DCC1 n=1 Tax=Linnemannia schmuckeri TaxID=64567 RepID=A0A9P5RZ47_9FUNG|nr:Sister chromatid cohesion protein DCC1 [Linnemannia schmuckeri]